MMKPGTGIKRTLTSVLERRAPGRAVRQGEDPRAERGLRFCTVLVIEREMHDTGARTVFLAAQGTRYCTGGIGSCSCFSCVSFDVASRSRSLSTSRRRVMICSSVRFGNQEQIQMITRARVMGCLNSTALQERRQGCPKEREHEDRKHGGGEP